MTWKLQKPTQPQLLYNPNLKEWTLTMDYSPSKVELSAIVNYTKTEFIRRRNGCIGEKRRVYDEALSLLNPNSVKILFPNDGFEKHLIKVK